MSTIIRMKLTYNQFLVFRYMLGEADATKRVRVSAQEIAVQFGWSSAYAQKILNKLSEKQLIELIESGRGRKANRYRLEKISLSNITTNHKPTLKQKSKKVVSTGLASIINKYRALRITNNTSESRRSNLLDARPLTASETQGFVTANGRLTILSKIDRRLPTISNNGKGSSAFIRFDKKKHRPDLWNCQDIVCYFMLLYRCEYGYAPITNWPRSLGAAKRLLNRMNGDGSKVKRYMQAAFATSPEHFHPHSLSPFMQEWVIDKVYERINEGDISNLSDYSDDRVFAR